MESIKQLYKIGPGPSSSHTMGPQKAALLFKQLYPNASRYDVTLYGSLALTGVGHLTDHIIKKALGEVKTNIIFNENTHPKHPNTMLFEAYNEYGDFLGKKYYYSIGGGSLKDDENFDSTTQNIYDHDKLTDIINYCNENNLSLVNYILKFEGDEIISYLRKVIDAMFECVERGISASGVLPGKLALKRVAKSLYLKACQTNNPVEKEKLYLMAFAYAVSEENASGGQIVTSPTCGASGVIPSILYYFYKFENVSKSRLINGLLIAGLIGNIVKSNATISGAKGGCQAEVGTACAMGAAMIAYFKNLNINQIEYAAEIGMEHHLGLTCDPVGGYVQIPCIERNGVAVLRSNDAALLAQAIGSIKPNRISFDMVVHTMMETGCSLPRELRETSLGGLAKELEIDPK